MQINPEAAGTTSPSSLPARIGWAALIVATLYVCYFSHLGAIGFVGPDEPRYAWVARAMVESGDWVTPRLYGKPWFEKPVLYYWEAALSFKLFGVSEAAARLPSAVSALLATLALAWLAWRLYGAETARWLLLLLPTTVGMIGFSHAAAMDMPFTGMLTVAMVCAAVALRLIPERKNVMSSREPATAAGSQEKIIPPANRRAGVFSTPWLALTLFGFFLGLAVLAKGPAGIILCGGAVFFWALFSKRWHDAFRLLHPVAIASFCLTALPWYILCAHRNPDFIRIFIIEHNFKRYLTPEFQHLQPFWYYGPILIAAVFPWLAILVSALVTEGIATGRRSIRDDATTLLICWALFCLGFFSISQSKLPGYILPSVPAVGFLLVRHLTTLLSRSSAKARWVGLGTSAALILSGFLLSHFASKIPVVTDIQSAPFTTALAFFAIAGGVVCGVLALWRPGEKSLFAAAITVLAIMTLGSGDLWELDEGISARHTAEEVRENWPPERMENARSYRLRRDDAYALNFYAHREISEWSPADGSNVLIFSSYRNVENLKAAGVSCLQYVVYPKVILCGDTSHPNLPATNQRSSEPSAHGRAGGGKLQ